MIAAESPAAPRELLLEQICDIGPFVDLLREVEDAVQGCTRWGAEAPVHLVSTRDKLAAAIQASRHIGLYVSPATAAVVLKVSPQSVRADCRAEKIQGARMIGRNWRIPLRAVEEESRRRKAA